MARSLKGLTSSEGKEIAPIHFYCTNPWKHTCTTDPASITLRGPWEGPWSSYDECKTKCSLPEDILENIAEFIPTTSLPSLSRSTAMKRIESKSILEERKALHEAQAKLWSNLTSDHTIPYLLREVSHSQYCSQIESGAILDQILESKESEAVQVSPANTIEILKALQAKHCPIALSKRIILVERWLANRNFDEALIAMRDLNLLNGINSDDIAELLKIMRNLYPPYPQDDIVFSALLEALGHYYDSIPTSEKLKNEIVLFVDKLSPLLTYDLYKAGFFRDKSVIQSIVNHILRYLLELAATDYDIGLYDEELNDVLYNLIIRTKYDNIPEINSLIAALRQQRPLTGHGTPEYIHDDQNTWNSTVFLLESYVANLSNPYVTPALSTSNIHFLSPLVMSFLGGQALRELEQNELKEEELKERKSEQ